jgi:hypothetical protein
MQFIDERSPKVLPDRGCATSNENIPIARRIEGCVESFFDPAVDEMEGCSSLHFERRARVVSEHEDWVVKGGIFPPPTGPLARLPRATYRAEHVATHDGRTNTRLPLREEVVVESFATAFSPDHLIAAAGCEQPFVELEAPNPEWIVNILVRPGCVTIEGH